MSHETFEMFMETYNTFPEGKYDERDIHTIDVTNQRAGDERYLTPWIVVKSDHGTFILNVMPFDDHLCVDVHAFDAEGKDARTGVFGMEEGGRWTFPGNTIKGTSHKWNATQAGGAAAREAGGQVTEFTIDMRVRGFSDQPDPFVTAIIAAGIQMILQGIAEDVRLALLAEPATCN